MISEPVARRFERLIDRTLSRYRDHPDYEDLLADARLAALRVLAKMDEDLRPHADRVVASVALMEMRRFFRTNRLRSYTSAGTPLPKLLPLHEVEDACEDFSEEFVRLEWCRWVWKEAEKHTTPGRLMALREFAEHGTLAHRRGSGYTSHANAKQRAIQDLSRATAALDPQP